MNGPEILEIYRHDLSSALASYVPPPRTPLAISPWLAMGLLQKSIRRGRRDWALHAAATLLDDKPERFWRRIGVIAFEDIGLADVDAVGLATAALRGSTDRRQFGSEWAVASLLTERLATAAKCRASDDLLMVTERHPSLAQARAELASAAFPDLVQIFTGPSPMPIRALALWFAMGTDRYRSDFLVRRSGNPGDALDALCDAGCPHSVVEIVREGVVRTGQVLCGFVALMDQNEEIFSRFMNDRSFQKVLTSWLSAEAYQKLRE